MNWLRNLWSEISSWDWLGKQRRAQWEKDSQIKAHRQEYQDWLKETGYATTEDEVDAAYAENPRWAP